MDQHANKNDAAPENEQLPQALDRIATIVHFHESDEAAERDFPNCRPDDPVEFLCLSIKPADGRCNQPRDESHADSVSENPFPDSQAALCWVNKYRRFERDQIAEHVDSATSGSLFPREIVVVADPLPESDADAWHEESHRREKLARQGVMVIDRSHCSGDSVSDRQLVLETLRSVLAMSVGQTHVVQSPMGAPGFDWTVNKPGGHGDLYGNQPAHVEPFPSADEGEFNRDVAKRFETYSKAFSQDLDY